jgi:pimeloyl-ACP methyl ester carboxylesterase
MNGMKRHDAMHETWYPVGDRLVHAVEWTPGVEHAAAPPIVLVHGLGGSTVNWELVGGPLARRLSTRVVAFDLGGFGRTLLGTHRASLGENGRLLADLVRATGPGVVVGNSMGGALAVGLAAREPELVRALVLVDAALPRPLRPPGMRETVDGLFNLRGLAAAAVPIAGPRLVRFRMRQLGAPGTVDTSLRIVCAQPRDIDATLRRHMIDLTEYRATGTDSARSYHDAIRSLFRYTTRGMASDLRAITAPTLLVHGAFDRLVPVSLARSAARRRPDWTLEVFDRCGHVPMMEQPERFIDVTARWIATQLDYESEVGSSR